MIRFFESKGDEESSKKRRREGGGGGGLNEVGWSKRGWAGKEEGGRVLENAERNGRTMPRAVVTMNKGMVRVEDMVRMWSCIVRREKYQRILDGEKHGKEAEINIGDDTADWSALGLKSPEKETPKEQREAVLPTHDGWQSWA